MKIALITPARPVAHSGNRKTAVRWAALLRGLGHRVLVATEWDGKPADVMMVAAHLGDLRAAKGVGLRTAFVTRPLEYGPTGKPDLKADASVDLSATDFNDLARQLGA